MATKMASGSKKLSKDTLSLTRSNDKRIVTGFYGKK